MIKQIFWQENSFFNEKLPKLMLNTTRIMGKTITTFRSDLMGMAIGSSFEYKPKQHRGYVVTASTLKGMNKGEWTCSCKRFDRVGNVTRVA